MKRRVLLLTTEYPPDPGGIARLLAGIVAASADEVDWRVRVVRPSRPVGELWHLGADRRWLRGVPAGAVVCGHPYLSGLGIVVARACGVTAGCIVHGRELVPTRWAHAMLLRPLRHHTGVVAVSGHSARVAVRLGVPAAVVRVVPPEMAPGWAPLTPAAREVGAPLRLVSVGRLDDGYKNVELLLRLVAVLSAVGVVEHLTIVGDGRRRPAIEAKVRQLGLGGAVHLVGTISDRDLAGVLAEHDLGVFASRDSLAEHGFEGFGLVVEEMAASGLPVLVGRAAGAVDAAHPGWSTTLDPDDLGAWVTEVRRLHGDEEARRTMADQALAWAATVDSRATARRMLAVVAP